MIWDEDETDGSNGGKLCVVVDVLGTEALAMPFVARALELPRVRHSAFPASCLLSVH
jgi:hypothetical protein